MKCAKGIRGSYLWVRSVIRARHGRLKGGRRQAFLSMIAPDFDFDFDFDPGPDFGMWNAFTDLSRSFGQVSCEEIFTAWIHRFVLFHDKRHPDQMAEPEVVRFLSHLAVEQHVSPSAQTQARAALVFLYRHVLDRPLGRLDGIIRAKRPAAPIRSDRPTRVAGDSPKPQPAC